MKHIEPRKQSCAESLKAPEIRFKEFEENYRLTNLGNELNFFNGYAFSSNDSCEDGIRWVKIADVGINQMKLDSPSFLPIEYKTKYSKFLLHKGDYVVALTRPILGGKLKIAKVNDDFNGSLLNQRVGKLESKNDLEYMYFMLQQKSLISRIENRIAGTDPPNLSPNEVSTLKTFLPSLPEQQKIASFLSAVDEKIQLLNRKKELLENYKKGAMQQLFSQKLRFKDGNGKDFPDWEEKRLDFMISQFIVPMRDKPKDLSGEIPWCRIEDFDGKYLSKSKSGQGVNRDLIKAMNLKIFPIGTLLVSCSANLGFCAITETELMTNQTFIGLVPNKDKIDVLFLLYVMRMLSRKLNTLSSGTTISYLSRQQFEQFKIPYPSLLEQQKIASFLSSIDDKIEAVNQQITKSQIFKKGLLQQMFV